MKKNTLLVLAFICFCNAINGYSAIHKPKSSIGDDDYWTTPQKPYQERRQLYLNFCVANNNEGGRDGVFSQIARLELGLAVNEAMVREAIAVVYENKDCNDFAAGGLLRLYYINKKKHQLSQKLVGEIEACLTNFKYWWDEPEKDPQYRCYHTENHQGLYHEDELLAGQLFKDKLFKNGKTGAEHVRHSMVLLKRWMDYRVRFGFSEWLSNNYIDVDLLTLANLYDFAEDETVRSRAGLLIDVILYEMALNNFHGVFGSTHGRTYNRSLTGGRQEGTASIMKLMLGVGVFNSPKSMGAVCLASSSYRCPAVIENIATDYSHVLDNKERQSINIMDAPKYGLSYDNELDCQLYWGMQEFIHPKVIAMSQKVSEKYDVWPYRNYDFYKKQYEEQVQQYGKIINPNLDRYALSEANIETYRTNNFMLSSVQDYRAGSPGYQQHIWQASLGIDAVVFTNHPGEDTPTPVGKESSPAYWAGNKMLPRTAQYKNVLICIYNMRPNDRLPFSHAYFPRDAFNEVIEKGHWTFGRKDDGYIAVYSQNNAQWKQNDKGQQNELRVLSPQNIWICEMGAKKKWKSFSNFIKTISSSKVSCGNLAVKYYSPSVGETKFGWTEPFQVKRKVISLNSYPRFDNPYSKNEFTSNKVTIKYKQQELVLDFSAGQRLMQ